MAWVAPITWADGVTYTAAQLNQQFITNTGEMTHVMDTLAEDIDVPQADPALGGVLIHTLPITAGQLMIMTWCLVMADFETDAVSISPYVRVPTGAVCSGRLHYLNSNADQVVDTLSYTSSAPADSFVTYQWYIGGFNFDNHCVCIDILVMSTTQVGNVELRAHNDTGDSFKVKAGSTVIGFVGATT